MDTDKPAVWLPLFDPCERLEWARIFPQSGEVHVDLGAGDGGFALAFAAAHPGVNLLAVERLLGRLRKILKRGDRAGLSNLRAIRIESAYCVKYLLPAGSVDVIHVMHPDPWPKRAQVVNRLFQPDFVAACAAALKPGGELRLTLDHPGYFKDILAAVAPCRELSPEVWRPGFDYPQSDFERQFAAEDKLVFRQLWRRVNPR
jgi:tRNA (guanine-N7-)-methyltransferase